MTITEFLLARIAEDEAVAQAASEGPWHTYYVPQLGGGQYGDWIVDSERTFICSTQIHNERGERDSEHIVRHDPDRVLAECVAKRAIVENAEYWNDQEFGTITRGVSPDRLGEVLRVLAPVYADHPDYQQEWAL